MLNKMKNTVVLGMVCIIFVASFKNLKLKK